MFDNGVLNTWSCSWTHIWNVFIISLFGAIILFLWHIEFSYDILFLWKHVYLLRIHLFELFFFFFKFHRWSWYQVGFFHILWRNYFNDSFGSLFVRRQRWPSELVVMAHNRKCGFILPCFINCPACWNFMSWPCCWTHKQIQILYHLFWCHIPPFLHFEFALLIFYIL